jgi:Ca-activated chloride channel homolog
MKRTNSYSKTLPLLVISAIFLAIVFSISGCKKKSDTTEEPTQPTIQQLVTNGTILPFSPSIVKGALFIVDEKGQYINGITAANVSAKLKWVGPKSVDSLSLDGLVTVSSNQQLGLHVAAAVTMDYSGSMSQTASVIPNMEKGVKTFIHSMAPTDLGEIIKFSTHVYVPQPFTSDTVALDAGVDNNNYSLYSTTALYQSIFQGLEDAVLVDSSHFIRTVIGFTDGGENASSIQEDDLLNYAIHHGIPINTIGFLTADTDTLDLRYIAESTGGFFFLAENDSTFSKIYATISGQLKNSYSYSATWQGTLPSSGTTVTASITTTYQGKTSTFSRTYIQP